MVDGATGGSGTSTIILDIGGEVFHLQGAPCACYFTNRSDLLGKRALTGIHCSGLGLNLRCIYFQTSF